MADSFSLTWRSTNPSWLLFSNNTYKASTNKPIIPKDSKQSKLLPKQKSLFFFSNRKSETKGSLVYTPDGYGIIQDINSSMVKVPVKVNNKISEYSQDVLLSDIPITVRVISNSINQEEKITVPVFSTCRDLVEKVESIFQGDLALSSKIFYKGKELLKSPDTLEKIGMYPDSKLVLVSSMGKPFSVNRFTQIYQGWGYSNSTDGITFSASKDIRVMGFGIYTPDKEKSSLSVIASFIAGNDAKGNPLFSKEVNIAKDEVDVENKVFRFYFDRPIRIKSGEQYSCVIQIKSGNSFYGSSGQYSSVGEQDVTFTFTDCQGSMNGTSPSSGQIPEVYYFV